MTQSKNKYYYSGGQDAQDKEDPSLQPDAKSYDPQGRLYEPYLPDDDLREAVNLAICLNRPLLLEGEPGCGKTRLAGAIAYEFTQKYLKDKKGTPIKNEKGEPLWWPYYIWDVKSYGRARDGLYRFDAVARLRDAQLAGSLSQWIENSDLEEDEAMKLCEERKQMFDRLINKEKYIDFGPLGEALKSNNAEIRSKLPIRPIVLIDEIDKADSDFPNDLLGELDRMRFKVEETGHEYPTNPETPKPIIIITSNRERPLPEPFLRRCLYFYVEFPDDKQLQVIISRRFGSEFNQDLATSAIEKVKDIRKTLEGQPGSKLPGTSEILEFLEALTKYSKEPQQVIETLETQLPFLGILVKTQRDQKIYRKAKGISDE